MKMIADRVLVSHWKAVVAVQRQREERNLATIDKDCPNPEGCDAKVLSYYQQQLRGADEGSTTFYECKTCGHKFSENA